MTLSSLRLRRTLTALSTLHRSNSSTSVLSSQHPSSSPLLHGPTSAQSPVLLPQYSTGVLQSRTFRSSSLFSARSASYGNNEEIGPDTILFEGCDYNHWLIVMDFPKDNKPSSEEMVKTYEETCARGLDISVEEAKQKMYACSTTTYTGFQALMSEQESEKFHGLPGVVFVLPDSYIDPQNKEYGGDKYINGTIIPRPPPIQYGRQQGGRYNDRNRNPDQRRYERTGPRSNQQSNPSFGQQGQPMQGGWNNGASQNYPSPVQGENRGPTPVNAPGGQDAYQPGRDPMPSFQGNYNQGEQKSYHPREQSNFPQGQRSYASPGQGGSRGDDKNYGPPHTETQGQGFSGFQGRGAAQPLGKGPYSGACGQGPSSGPYGQGPTSGPYGQGPTSGPYGQGPTSGPYGQGPTSGPYGQGPTSGPYGQGPTSGPYGQGPTSGPYGGQSSGGYGQVPISGSYGQGPISGSYGQGPSSGGFGQGTNSGTYGQGPSPGAIGQGLDSGTYGVGTASGNGQSYPVHGGDQRFSRGEQRDVQGGQNSYAPMGQTGIDKGKY